MKSIIYANLNSTPEEMFDRLKELSSTYHTRQQQIFKQDIFPDDTYLIIKRFTHGCSCAKCLKQMTQIKEDNPIQCLGCGNTYHFSCTISDNQLFLCPNCRYQFGFHPLSLTIIHSPNNILRAPYKNAFGQFEFNCLGTRKQLLHQLIPELQLKLLTGRMDGVPEEVQRDIGFRVSNENVVIRRMNEMEFAKLAHEISEDEDIPVQERANVIRKWLRLRGNSRMDMAIMVAVVKPEVFKILTVMLDADGIDIMEGFHRPRDDDNDPYAIIRMDDAQFMQYLAHSFDEDDGFEKRDLALALHAFHPLADEHEYNVELLLDLMTKQEETFKSDRVQKFINEI